MADYNATKNPPHKTGGLPTTCENCHNPSSWLGRTSFDHNVDTSFPLTGSHTTTACLNCHVNGVYKGLPTACVSCHQADFNATTNPHHAAAGFSMYRSPVAIRRQAWPLAPFDHNTAAFPLTGAHVGHICISCHADKVYKGKPTNVHLVSPDGLQHDRPTEPRDVGLPDDLSHVPHDDAVDGGDVQSQHHRLPADWGAQDGDLQ